MSDDAYQNVADSIVRLARRVGSITPRDVRMELRIAGLPESGWKDVLELARPRLLKRQGRYFCKETFSPRVQKEQAQRLAMQKAIRRLIRLHQKQAKDLERRGQARVDFVHPIPVRTEDGQTFTLLSRDLSATGIRLIGTRRLLGQKVDVSLPAGPESPPCRMRVRILWTCAVGDDLFENGGSFLELVE